MRENSLIYILAAWLLPGAGHLLLKRWASGAAIATTIILMLLIGLRLSGIHLLETDAEKGIMYYFHQVASLGNAGAYLLLWAIAGNASLAEIQNALKSETFEYGVRFFAAAGLLNYLAVLDVADICLRRKR